MDQHIKKINWKQILIKVAWCLVIAGLLIFVWKVKSTLTPVFAAIILAYVFLPYQKKLETKMSKTLASMIVILTILIAVFLIVFFILPVFIDQITKLIDTMPKFIEKLGTPSKLQEQLNTIGVSLDIKQFFLDQISALASFLQSSAESLLTLLSNIFNIIAIIAFIPFFMYYFLKDRNRFSKEMLLIIPAKFRNTTKTISSEVNVSLRAYIKGQIIISILEGAFSVVGFLIIGLNYAVLLGVILGLFNLIPYIGVLIGSIFALFVALITGVEHIVPTIIVLVIVQQIQGFVAPKVVGNSIGMHPVYVLITILISGYLFGLVGMFLGLPVVMTLKIIFSHIYNKFVSPYNP